MTTTRRGFLGAMLRAAAAPAFVRVDSLMRIVAPRAGMLTLWGDGQHDDTAALQAILAGASVMHAGEQLATQHGLLMLPRAIYKVSDTLVWAPSSPEMQIDSSRFFATPEMPIEKPMFFVDPRARGRLENCHFDRGLCMRAPGEDARS